MSLFKSPKGPREQLFEVQGKFRNVKRKLARERMDIERQSKASELEIKKIAKTGNMHAARLIAEQLVKTRKHISKLYEAEATVDCINREIGAQMRLNECLKSLAAGTKVISDMNKLYSLPQISKDMCELSKEMQKMHLIDELVSDTMEDAFAVDEKAVDHEIDALISSIISDKLKDAPSVAKDQLPATSIISGPSQEPVTAEEDAEDLALKSRLQALLE